MIEDFIIEAERDFISNILSIAEDNEADPLELLSVAAIHMLTMVHNEVWNEQTEDTEERECIEEMIDEAEDLYKSCPDETREDWEAHIMRDYYRTR